MAPSIKLTYFDGRGRAEISRLVMAAANKPFEDVRIGFPDWPKVKATTPLGTLPMLEVGGKKYSQGLAVATFLARENGLYGSNNLDGLEIDQIQQVREDLLTSQSKTMFEKDEATKAELMKKLKEETYPKVFGFFNSVVKESKSGFVVGKKLSLADLVIYEGTQTVFENEPAILDAFPELKKLRAKVESDGNVKSYLAKRKKTQFWL